MQNLNRLTNEQMASKARVTHTAHGYDYLSLAETDYHSRVLAGYNTNGMGYHTSNEDIISELVSFPLLTVVKHHYKNNDMKTEFVKEWKKVSDDAWVTV